MAEGKGVSFNPDDASGLLDNARVKVTGVKVSVFASKAGAKYVNVDMTFKGEGQEITEHYMLGSAEQWKPMASGTGAESIKDDGRVWNRSDVYKLVKSFIDAGFPKNLISDDLSVLVGADVHVNRVTQEGTYKDAEGKERQRTTLLVTKIYELPKAGAAGKATKATKASTAASAAAAPAADGGSSGDDNDAYVTELLVEILSEASGPVEKTKLPQPAFIKLTRAKKVAIRQAVTERLQSDAFLGSLVKQGLITYDGKVIALNG